MNSEIVPKSAIKKRKTPIEAYKDAYEKPNPQVESRFSRRSRKIHRGSKLSQIEIMPEFALEDFQAEQPITTAIAKIPSRSMSATAQALPSKQKHGSVSKVSPREISVSKPRSAKSRKNYKKMFEDVVNIQDATFTDEFGETPAVSAISAQKLKSLAAGKKQDPESMRAISAQKAKTKSLLAKVEPDEKSPSFASDGFRVEPASTVKSAKKARKVNDRWLIDAAADELYHTVNVVGKAAGKAVKEGFKATRTGIKAINTITGDIIENPAMKNIAKQHETTLQGMANNARRARGSILATGNNANKRYMSAGSLFTQHGFGVGTRTNTTIVPQTNMGMRVVPKVVRRGNKDVVLYFLENGQQVSAAQARLIRDGIIKPPQVVETTENVNLGYNNNQLVNKPIKTAAGLVTRHYGSFGNNQTIYSPVVNKPRIATPSMLIIRR